MYGVVLLAALSAGGNATPAWHHGCGGCHGWSGCHGGCYGCYGCYGYSGCYGFGGCYGGCYGCYGGYGGCYGCSGCYGSCYGSYGCYGCSGCYGASYWPGAAPVMAPATGGASLSQPSPDGSKVLVASPQPARVTVELPEDAKLFVDDQEMKTPSGKRVFRTPNLDPGQTYYYVLRAEVARDGKPSSETKRILVRAGEEVRTSFNELAPVNTAQVDTKNKPVAAR